MTYAARARRHVPGPLHGVGGPQRPAPGAGPRPRLEPLGARLRAPRTRPGRSLDGGRGADVRTFATEAEVYEFLGLPFIEPELREDRGEIEAALAGRLPTLVRSSDLQGDCHTPLGVVGRPGVDRDHGGDGTPTRLRVPGADRPLPEPDHRQRPEPERRWSSNGASSGSSTSASRARRRQGRRPRARTRTGSGCSTAASWRSRVDGRLDYDDELLARYDVVVASLHVGRKQPRAQLMARYETALRSPHVDIIAHPSGRKIGQRPDLDLDWEASTGSPPRPARCWRSTAPTSGWTWTTGASGPRSTRAAASPSTPTPTTCRSGTTSSGARPRRVAAGSRRAHVANTLPRDEFLALMAEKPHRM